MGRIGAIVRSYHMTKYLRAVLKNLAHLDVVLVANHRFRGAEEKPDDTEEIVKDYKNVILDKGDDSIQHEVFLSGLKILKKLDCGYVFINDADELMTRKDRDEMVAEMVSKKLSAGFARLIDYVSDPFHIPQQHYPFREHRPVMIVEPGVKFYDTRNLMYGNGKFFDKYVHHFGYTCNEDDMKWKSGWYATPKQLAGVKKQRLYDCKIPDEIMELLKK